MIIPYPLWNLYKENDTMWKPITIYEFAKIKYDLDLIDCECAVMKNGVCSEWSPDGKPENACLRHEHTLKDGSKWFKWEKK